MIFKVIHLRRLLAVSGFSILCLIAATAVGRTVQTSAMEDGKDFIKYVEFNVPYEALERSLNADIKRKGGINWIDLLSHLACKYGGEWKRYKNADMDAFIEKLDSGETVEESRYFSYYQQAYGAILGGMVGNYLEESLNAETGETQWVSHYGLKTYSPIAKGYWVTGYDDFGAKRSYGYSRPHLGHDLMGQTGTPIIAIEGGTVEALGWNQYGGWRIGIRSFDKKRYWYYAHLRKNRPFASGLMEGDTVTAGDVIGYMGRTGYSTNENVNNIEETHLHLGLELVFDESQKESDNEIWINLYSLTKLLEKHKTQVIKMEETKEYYRKYQYIDCGGIDS